MKKTDKAWAAGIIDGEGCISIIRVPASRVSRCIADRFTLHLKVTMGDKRTVEKLYEIFKTGSVQMHVPKSKKLNSSYSWICQTRQAENVLKKVRKYLITKAEEADVGLEFLALPLAKRGGRGGSSKTSFELSRKREALYWKLRKLKPRWRFYIRKRKSNERILQTHAIPKRFPRINSKM